jgi:hypothetical protein
MKTTLAEQLHEAGFSPLGYDTWETFIEGVHLFAEELPEDRVSVRNGECPELFSVRGPCVFNCVFAALERMRNERTFSNSLPAIQLALTEIAARHTAFMQRPEPEPPPVVAAPITEESPGIKEGKKRRRKK